MSVLGDAALAYAARGLRVLPLHTVEGGACSCGKPDGSRAGKHPRTHNGLDDATRDVAKVRAWWERWPSANIGLRTGGGLVVLDVDGPEGEESLAELEREHGRLPETAEVRTGRDGGRHLWFHAAAPIGNRTGVRPGLDVRGDGGFVIAPPSRHASGRAYRWTRPWARLRRSQNRSSAS